MPQLSVQVKNADLVAKQFEDLRAEIPQISKGRIYGRMQSAKKRITKYPPRYAGTPATFFKSERQRKFVMAGIRNGTIQVPYQRTGRYGDSWKIKNLPAGYQLFARMSGSDYTKFVGGNAYGRNQARIHGGRWPVAKEEIDRAIEGLPEEILSNIVTAAHRKGFR